MMHHLKVPSQRRIFILKYVIAVRAVGNDTADIKLLESSNILLGQLLKQVLIACAANSIATALFSLPRTVKLIPATFSSRQREAAILWIRSS